MLEAVFIISNKNKLYNGFIDCLVKCYNKGGVMGLYAGLIPNIYANFVYRGLLFGLHDSKVNSTSFSMNFLITFINSSFAITIALPFDTIKRRLMVQTTKDVKDYKGVIDCFRKIYINEGYKGYMRGATANIIKSLGTALTLILNDKLFEYYISNYKI